MTWRKNNRPLQPNQLVVERDRYVPKTPEGIRARIETLEERRRIFAEIRRRDRLQTTALWRKNAYRTNLNFRLGVILRGRLHGALKGRAKSSKTMELLGCSIESFKIYLESKFEPGMSWENYGHKGWHIDHIMPCAIFDLSKPEHQARCFHFSNLQPLWAEDNLRKKAKVPEGLCAS